MKLSRLYKTTKTGAIQICDISAENEIVTVTFGQLDGKLQSKTTTCSPKNEGRSNATTAEEQAILEAKSKWNKKTKSGYVEESSGTLRVRLPQKVKPYLGNENKIKFPAYSTCKYNGVNALYWLQEDGSLKLTSRGGDEYPAIPHLEQEVKDLMDTLDTYCLNGELYIHGEHLQDITSAVRKPKELSKKLVFKVFEFPLVDKPFKDEQHLFNFSKAFLHPADIQLVNNSQELEDHYNQAIFEGYEGTVIYNADAEYKFNTRSSQVYKYKKTQDAEYKVIDFSLDKNGHPVYICEVNNTTFKVKRKGTHQERINDAANATSNLGKWLTVEYEMLSKAGTPLKPVGLSFRECDNLGNPKE